MRDDRASFRVEAFLPERVGPRRRSWKQGGYHITSRDARRYMSCGHVVVTLARFCSRVVGPLDRSVRDSEAALGRGGRQMESSSNLIASRSLPNKQLEHRRYIGGDGMRRISGGAVS